MTMPVTEVDTPNVARRLSATELACTMLPMPNAASETKRSEDGAQPGHA